MRKRPPTIHDVARRAGVSVATVSRAMNGSDKVRQATRQAVQTAIAELGYSPSWLARDLRQERSNRVLVLFPSLHSPVMADVFRGIDDVARANGYYSLICPTAKDSDREHQLVNLVSSRVVDGIIFFGTTLTSGELSDLALRHSIVQCAEWEQSAATSAVTIDDHAAAIEITNHLLELGHTSLGMLTNRAEFSGRLRELGFREALAAAGLRVQEDFIVECDYEYSSGRTAARRLLSQKRRPNAVVCVSDVVAAGAIAEARLMGLTVPSDVAVTGFDDTREAMLSVPSITTIRQPFVEIGRQAMELTLLGMSASPPSPAIKFLPHELVIRDSTQQRSAEEALTV